MAGRAGSTSQSGKAAELAVACALMTTTSGRLSPFAPIVDDHGLDLLVLDKQTNAVAGVQVKSWVRGDRAGRGTVQFDIRRATYRAAPNWFLLAAVVDPATTLPTPVWLIPMALAPSLSIERPEKYALCPSPAPSSSDRYTPFRHADMAATARSLIAQLNGAARAP